MDGQEAMIKTIPRKINAKRQNGCLRRQTAVNKGEAKAKEKRKDIPI